MRSPFRLLMVGDYLVMREDGKEALDMDRLMGFAEQIEQELERETSRVLVDCRASEKTYSFADAYRIVEAFRDRPGFRSGHIAILGDYDHEFEKSQALAFHFQEAGVDVRAFLDYDRAAAWLSRAAPGDSSAKPG